MEVVQKTMFSIICSQNVRKPKPRSPGTFTCAGWCGVAQTLTLGTRDKRCVVTRCTNVFISCENFFAFYCYFNR